MKTKIFTFATLLLLGASIQMNGQNQLQSLTGELNVVVDGQSCIEEHSGLWFFGEDTWAEDLKAIKQAIGKKCGTTKGLKIQMSWLKPEYCGNSGGRQR
jgi:hypothetical protein